MLRPALLITLLATPLAACRTSVPPPLHPPERFQLAACGSTPPALPIFSQRRTSGPLTQAERDSSLRALELHRNAWRARNLTDYRLVVAAGCFCPWPGTPAVLDVRRGAIVQLLDTLGHPAGAVREPWSLYTVDGLFDAVAEGLRRDDVIEVGYDACYDFPTTISGDGKVGLPDDWFWVKASRLTPR